MSRSHSDSNARDETVVVVIPDNQDFHSSSTHLTQTTLVSPEAAPSEDTPDMHASGDLSGDACPPSHTTSSSTDKSKLPADVGMSEEVEFRVGKDRQLMIGSRSELATISPVLRTLFVSQARKAKQTVVEIPDVPTQSFGVILRCAAQDSAVPLSEDTVWNVLQAAHHLQMAAVTARCFHFLLHKHPQRHRARHLCKVLENSHQLGYGDHHAKSLHRVKRHAGNILQSPAALSELCHQCLTEIVTAEDLPVAEMVIHDGVVSWARAACRKDLPKAEPSWEELRAVAGQLAYQVRYLAMPRHTLQGLRAGEPGCLLSLKEKARLLDGNVSGFPHYVSTQRLKKGVNLDQLYRLVLRWKERKAVLFSVVGVLVVLMLVFWGVYLCTSEVSAAASSEPESPVYILMMQEEQQPQELS